MKLSSWKFIFACFTSLTLLVLSSCNKKDDAATVDIEETGQQIGDVMASIDESSGSTSGTLAQAEQEAFRKAWVRYDIAPLKDPSFYKIAFPFAQAASCATASTFGSCSSNSITRTYGGCTVGSATVDGTITLNWGGGSSGCAMQAANDYVTRSPNFTMTGRRNATFTVTKVATNGQKILWQSGTGTSKIFKFSSDGIRRVFAAGGTTLFDFTTQTTSDLTITGTARSSRTLSGGTLRVTNNLTSQTCDYTPTDVTWNRATCNCPVSGSWSASCSDGKTSTVSITGCGTGSITMGDQSQSFSFDRCTGS